MRGDHYGIEEILDRLGDRMNAEFRENVETTVRAGEAGVAVEGLALGLHGLQVRLTRAEADAIAAAGRESGAERRHYEVVYELVEAD